MSNSQASSANHRPQKSSFQSGSNNPRKSGLLALTTLELRSLYGINVLFHTRDTKEKRKKLALSAVILLAFLMLLSYVGGLSYGLIFLGLSEVVPAYLITIASMLIFFFGVFKAGGTLFRQRGYDILFSLPVTQTAIVLSRILRMYMEHLILTLGVLLPGLGVYCILVKPGFSFYIMSILGSLLLPLIPMTGATLIGALITGISSRMKHKSLVTTVLSLLAVLILMIGSSALSGMEDQFNLEMLRELSGMITALLKQLYPPAVWLGNTMLTGNFADLLLFAGLSFGILALVTAGISLSFRSICRSLYSTTAKHNYKMQTLKKNSVLATLCKRELKRYFSSSIYVTNTIIGPLLGTVFCGALLFADVEQITSQLPIDIHMNAVAPFLMATIFCTMSTTSTSVSMEGKNWWIAKSLPLTMKQILDAKILLNLIIILPFFLVSEVLMILALKPSIPELLFFLLVPTIIILFSCIWGITANLLFPVFQWENETQIVKQSASAAVGGFGGMLLGALCMVPAFIIPMDYIVLYEIGVCVIVFGLSSILYWKNQKRTL